MRSFSRKKKHGRKRKKRKSGLPLKAYAPDDYIYQVIDALLEDLQNELSRDHFRMVKGLVRRRDLTAVTEYLKSTASLQRLAECMEMPLNQVRALRMLDIGKKYLEPGDEFGRKFAALQKFIAAEDRCRTVNRRGFPQGFDNEDLFELPMFETARAFIKKVLGPLDLNKIFELQNHGQGTTLSSGAGMTSVFDKSQPPFTVTQDLETLFFYQLCTDDRWLSSLMIAYSGKSDIAKKPYGEERFRSWTAYRYKDAEVPSTGLPFKILLDYPPEQWTDFWRKCISVVNYNEILLVPKDSDIHRVIAREPSANIYMQLGVGNFIRNRLRSFGIDLKDQDKNRFLAQYGSLAENVATIDLSDASDSISRAFFKYMMPQDWWELLDSMCAKEGRIPKEIFGEEVNFLYAKQMSQGNGFTFPVQSLLFSALVYAVIKQAGESWRDNLDETAIYGDDIIVPTRFYHEVVRLLHRSGFKVNNKKSFHRGRVRESCGLDGYNGHDIRPVYIEKKPEMAIEILIHRNKIAERFIEYFGYEPLNVFKRLEKWLPKQYKVYGPYCESYESWLFSLEPRYEQVYVPDLQLDVWIIQRLRCTRSPLPVPKAKLAVFGPLLHNLRALTEHEWAGLFDKPLPKKQTRFVVLGRNCPKKVKKGAAMLLEWPKPSTVKN